MHQDSLKIYIDRLKEDEEERIEEVVSPEFMDVAEKELLFQNPVSIKGKAYLTKEHLVIHASIETEALMPCSICNEMNPCKIAVLKEYFTIPLAEIKGLVFDYGNKVREALLLEIPHFFECREGKCPQREGLKNFLKEEKDEGEDLKHYPFSQLK